MGTARPLALGQLRRATWHTVSVVGVLGALISLVAVAAVSAAFPPEAGVTGDPFDGRPTLVAA
ncbi:MAG: hypothetical protein ACFCU2_02250 [Acidimicrobiia bacterium]